MLADVVHNVASSTSVAVTSVLVPKLYTATSGHRILHVTSLTTKFVQSSSTPLTKILLAPAVPLWKSGSLFVALFHFY